MTVEVASNPSEGETDATSEQALVSRLARGEQRAFEVLMRKYNQRLFRVARAILGDDGEAEDAVQAAYLSAYVAVTQFAGRSSLGTWLTRIVINEALCRRRAKLRHRTLESIEQVADSVVDPHRTPEEAVTLQQLIHLVEAAIDALPASYRLVLVLREVQGLSSEETGESLGVSTEVVRVRLHRARAMLREQLIGLTGEEPDVELFAFAGQRCDRIVAGVLSRLRETA